jgi:hypothetical protein
MPSKSDSQARLMAAAAHTPGGYGGVPQSVGQDFNQADKGGKLLSHAMRKQKARADALRKRAKAPPASPQEKDEFGGG